MNCGLEYAGITISGITVSCLIGGCGVCRDPAFEDGAVPAGTHVVHACITSKRRVSRENGENRQRRMRPRGSRIRVLHRYEWRASLPEAQVTYVYKPKTLVYKPLYSKHSQMYDL